MRTYYIIRFETVKIREGWEQFTGKNIILEKVKAKNKREAGLIAKKYITGRFDDVKTVVATEREFHEEYEQDIA